MSGRRENWTHTAPCGTGRFSKPLRRTNIRLPSSRVENSGVEPLFSVCRTEVIPLYEFPSEAILGIEPNLRTYQVRVLPEHLTAKWQRVDSNHRSIGYEPIEMTWLLHAASVAQLGIGPSFPACRAGVFPPDPWASSIEGGRRTRKQQALDLLALPICVPRFSS